MPLRQELGWASEALRRNAWGSSLVSLESPGVVVGKAPSGFSAASIQRRILGSRYVTVPVAWPTLTSTRKRDGEYMTIKNERHTMHLLFTPFLASGIWIGGGSVGLILVIVVVVLLLRG
jgi:hypothetical protein